MKIKAEIEITNFEEIKQIWFNMFKEIQTSVPIITPTKPKRKWKFSDNGINKLAEFEDNILTVYPDEGGKPTIGIGHLLTKSELASGKIIINGVPIKYSDGITNEQSEDLLIQDLNDYETCVNNYVDVKLTQPQYDALVIFCYNVGEGAFEGSTLLKLLNEEHYEEVPTQMRRWNKVTKDGVLVVSQGLINRREKEILIWESQYA